MIKKYVKALKTLLNQVAAFHAKCDDMMEYEEAAMAVVYLEETLEGKKLNYKEVRTIVHVIEFIMGEA